MNGRFTIDGSEKLERELLAICAEVRDRIRPVIAPRNLCALVLGGGYGRGEGGVLTTDLGDRPYNDLEFYILTRGNLFSVRRYTHAIAQVAESLSHRYGIEIELKLLPLRKLERTSVTMFFYDLVSGHRLIDGADTWLVACEHHRAAHRIPLHEATRLLMNRCSGLLFAQERLRRDVFGSGDADFVGRNLAKAKLAFGDVILATRGQYHWSCRERHKRLRKLSVETSDETIASLLLLHEQGIDFKLHPVRTQRSPAELAAELQFLKDMGRELWLQVESRRLGQAFHSIEAYAIDSFGKCPETNPMKNRLINVRTFGLGSLSDKSYPRERLLRALALLLWSSVDHQWLPVVQDQLRTTATDYRSLVNAYEQLWKHYN